LIESKLCHRPGRPSPDMRRYNIIIGAGQGISREAIR
jgi:hypothetical protein